MSANSKESRLVAMKRISVGTVMNIAQAVLWVWNNRKVVVDSIKQLFNKKKKN